MSPRLFCAALLALPLSALASPADAPVTGPIVHLPDYAINDKALPPKNEIWRYARIPGFEILAQTSDANIQRLAGDLTRTLAAVGKVWPAINSAPDVQSTIIICNSESRFSTLVPQKVLKEMTLPTIDRLFLHDGASRVTVLYVSGAADPGLYERDLLRVYMRDRLAGVRPALPAWFVEGIAQIIAHPTYPSNQTVTFGTVADPGPNSVPPQSIEDGVRTTPDVQDIIQGTLEKMVVTLQGSDDPDNPSPPQTSIDDGPKNNFITYFADIRKPLPSAHAIFTGPPALDRTGWNMACWLFVHFCLFGHGPAMQPALANFLALIAQHPQTDPTLLFEQAFHRSPGSLAGSLRGYADSIQYKAQRYDLPATPPLELRDAAHAEIGQILGDAYRLAGYPGLAGAEMVDAYRLETIGHQEHGLRLVAALGALEQDQGEAARAQPLLETAFTAGYPSASAGAALARLRLAAVAGRPLTATETAACLAPLNAAIRSCPPDPEIYDLQAQVWDRSAAPPSRAELAVLNRGIGLFPDDTALALATIQLNLRFGYVDMAKLVAHHETALALDAPTRARLDQLQAELSSK